jgi:hypothetical protein
MTYAQVYSYFRYLSQDKYILTSMSILCCICVWHAVVNVVITSFSSAVADVADKVALGVLAFVYIGFHILFVTIIVCVVSAHCHGDDQE